MNIGDLVRLPSDNYYWWGDKVGLVIGVENEHLNFERRTLKIVVSAHDPEHRYVKFGANYVDLVSESR